MIMFIVSACYLNETFYILQKTLWEHLEIHVRKQEDDKTLTTALVLYNSTDKQPIEIKFLKIRVTKRNTFYFVMGFALSRVVSLYVSYFY